jgi:Zn-finger nucleic acid-binding protein
MMYCPICKNVGLVMAERQGIEIDYCPACRGVWLDRGELDKIIERAIQGETNQTSGPTTSGPTNRFNPTNEQGPGEWLRSGHSDHHERDSHRRDEHGYSQQGHRGSFWKELFD